MKIDLKFSKYKSEIFPFRFFDNDAEWDAYSKEFPEIVAKAVEDVEKRFTGIASDAFSQAVEYIPRSLIGRKYQYWMAHRLIALMNERSKGRVLDYGCGAGNMGMIFAHAGFQVDLADVKGVITDFLKWRVKRHFLKIKVLGHEDDLGEGRYDLVCMQNVIEHLDKPLEVLQKLTRAMAVGAYFLITCYTTGKGLDVVTFETLEKIIWPYLLDNFTPVEDTDNMLFLKK